METWQTSQSIRWTILLTITLLIGIALGTFVSIRFDNVKYGFAIGFSLPLYTYLALHKYFAPKTKAESTLSDTKNYPLVSSLVFLGSIALVITASKYGKFTVISILGFAGLLWSLPHRNVIGVRSIIGFVSIFVMLYGVIGVIINLLSKS